MMEAFPSIINEVLMGMSIISVIGGILGYRYFLKDLKKTHDEIDSLSQKILAFVFSLIASILGVLATTSLILTTIVLVRLLYIGLDQYIKFALSPW